MTFHDPWLAAVAAVTFVFVGIGALTERVRDWRTPAEGTPEYVQHLYAAGRIDEQEMERRLDVVLDPEAERIRAAAERVSGIGEQTSWDLAAEFDTLDELRAADRERLTTVSNIGAQRARALEEEL